MNVTADESEGNNGCSSSTVERISVISDDAAINHANGDEMIWIPDSGATIHATSHRVLHKLHSM